MKLLDCLGEGMAVWNFLGKRIRSRRREVQDLIFLALHVAFMYWR